MATTPPGPQHANPDNPIATPADRPTPHLQQVANPKCHNPIGDRDGSLQEAPVTPREMRVFQLSRRVRYASKVTLATVQDRDRSTARSAPAGTGWHWIDMAAGCLQLYSKRRL